MRTAETIDIDDSLDFETLQSVLREHPIRLAILFGSHATGETHSASDIDIAVEFEAHRPSDQDYNNTFLGLSADLSDTLNTDEVDLVDLHALSPTLAESVFETGVLLVGDQKHAVELRHQITTGDDATQSPRERLDTALARIDAHLDNGDTGVPVTGESETDR